MIDDREQTQARQPVRVGDPAARDCMDRRAAFGRDQHAVPFNPPRARLPEMRNELSRDRPGELSAQPREGVVPDDWIFLEGTRQLLHQLLEPRLLTLQPGQALLAV